MQHKNSPNAIISAYEISGGMSPPPAPSSHLKLPAHEHQPNATCPRVGWSWAHPGMGEQEALPGFGHGYTLLQEYPRSLAPVGLPSLVSTKPSAPSIVRGLHSKAPSSPSPGTLTQQQYPKMDGNQQGTATMGCSGVCPHSCKSLCFPAASPHQEDFSRAVPGLRKAQQAAITTGLLGWLRSS